MCNKRSLITILFCCLLIYLYSLTIQIDFVFKNKNYFLYILLVSFVFLILLKIYLLKIKKNKISYFISIIFYIVIYKIKKNIIYSNYFYTGGDIIILWLIFISLFFIKNIYMAIVSGVLLFFISFLIEFNIFQKFIFYIFYEEKKKIILLSLNIIIYLLINFYLRKYKLENNRIFPSLNILNNSKYKIINNPDFLNNISLKNFPLDCKINKKIQGPIVINYYITYKNDLTINHLEIILEDLSEYLKKKILFFPQEEDKKLLLQIPNIKKSTINFVDILKNKKNKIYKLQVFLGLDTFGNSVVYDLLYIKNFCISGESDYSKTNLLKVIICGFLMTKTPKEVELIIINLRDDLDVFSFSNHIVHKIFKSYKDVINVLSQLKQEIEKRHKILKEQNLSFYEYKKNKSLPYIVLIINNFDDFININIDVTKIFYDIIKYSKEVGVFTIFTIKDPSNEQINNILKNKNILKSSLKSSNKLKSKYIIRSTMAENLLEYNDLLILQKNYNISRIHIPNIINNEIKNIIEFWKNII
ncbi:hypothetical protein AB836_01525 [Rickettsiales bacterium (ex Bugula neritina AB1)]|nr:hypothetical protein AB836_01525 [Rickettsiales bacterium (ex Bugula neritina AB1)]